MLAYNLQPAETTFAQAMAAYWANVGVTAQITTPASFAEYVSEAESKKYSAQAFEYGAQPIYVDTGELIYPSISFFNAFHSDDPVMDSLWNKIAVGSTVAAQTSVSNELETRILDQAWFVPVAYTDETFFVSPKIRGFVLDPPEVSPDPIDWYLAS